MPFLVFAGDDGDRSAFCTMKRSILLAVRTAAEALQQDVHLFVSGGKKKKERDQNNAKGKHQQENSMFFVMLFLWGHLLLAIRLNH